MAKTVAITVHPAPLGAEQLTISDAMRQVLDFVDALELAEQKLLGGETIVWRLQSARTNSPPFTVVAEATGANPTVSVDLQAQRVEAAIHETLDDLVERNRRPDWFDAQTEKVFRRFLKRNTNGVGRTDIAFDDATKPVHIVPTIAIKALSTLEKADAEDFEAEQDWTHTEYGSREGNIFGLIRYYGVPAVVIRDRLSGDKITCVFQPDTAKQLGPEHRWEEAWNGLRVLVRGALHYDAEGKLRKIDAESIDTINPPPVSLNEIGDANLLVGKSVGEHLDEFWKARNGDDN